MKIIIVDFSHLVWTCWYAAPEKWQENLRSKISTLESVFYVNSNNWIFVKDNPAKAKFEIFPDYKGGRTKPDVDPRIEAEKILKAEGCRFVQSPDHEADDTLATLAVSFESPTGTPLTERNKVIVVTGDRDLWQLLHYSFIGIFDPIRKEFFSTEHVKKSFGVEDPIKIRLIKTLWGDTSDNIPNVVPRMQKQLMPLIEQSQTLQELIVHASLVPLTPRCRELLYKANEALNINWQLTGLTIDVPLVWE